MKRIFDLMVAGVGLVIASPVMLLAALLVRLGSPGPVLFRQERIGRNFRPFRIYKFRSMACDAPQRGGTVTTSHDPRITPVGRWLRCTKLDELPQLLNVLRGDMSLVGPRPEVAEYVRLFVDDYEHVLSLRPGITDLASMKYREEEAILAQAKDPEREYVERVLPDKLRLAKAYVDRSSLGFDLLVIAATALLLLGSPWLGQRLVAAAEEPEPAQRRAAA